MFVTGIFTLPVPATYFFPLFLIFYPDPRKIIDSSLSVFAALGLPQHIIKKQ